jgi:hypothetical protein
LGVATLSAVSDKEEEKDENDSKPEHDPEQHYEYDGVIYSVIHSRAQE